MPVGSQLAARDTIQTWLERTNELVEFCSSLPEYAEVAQPDVLVKANASGFIDPSFLSGAYNIDAQSVGGETLLELEAAWQEYTDTLLLDYVSNASLAITLGDYVTDLELSTILQDYAETADVSAVGLSGEWDDILNKPENILTGNGNLIVVKYLSDFPAPVGNVITLAANCAYFIVGMIDLVGNRLVGSDGTSLFGSSSEVQYITSTGLEAPEVLITSNFSFPMRDVTISSEGADYALFALDGLSAPAPGAAIDWRGVNIVDSPAIGTIENYNNFIYQNGLILDSQNLVFDGTFQTVAQDTLLVSGLENETIISFAATAVVNRRARIIYSSVVVPTGGLGLEVLNPATFPNNESAILDTIQFSGDGEYISAALVGSNKTLFVNCSGIQNSQSVGKYSMTSNATATTITQNVYSKVAGVTTNSAYTQKFLHANNEFTYDGAFPQICKVTQTISATSGNNHTLFARIAVDTGSGFVTLADTQTRATTSQSGAAELIVCIGLLLLNPGDKVSLYITNGTSSTNITVADLQVTIDKVN